MKVLVINKISEGLFARLHPFTAKELYLDALERAQNVSRKEKSNAASFLGEWNVLNETKDEVVFLPLEIRYRDALVYVSFNGGQTRDENGELQQNLERSLV